MRVAAIGLGRMGGPIADHLVTGGHEVAVHDLDPAAMAPRIDAGARGASSPADAATGAATVHVVVFDDAQASEVVAGPDGVLATLAGGAVVCIHTTVRLDTIHALAEQAGARGIDVVDAGISGGEEGARAGTLLTMVGGPAAAIDRARPALDAFSKEVVHAGPLGAGMALKLARNAVGYALMTATHEAMELARRSGVDLETLRHTLAETAVADMTMAPFGLGGPEPLPPDAPTGQRSFLEHLARLGEKDLDQALDLARRVDASTPLFAESRRTFASVARVPDRRGA